MALHFSVDGHVVGAANPGEQLDDVIIVLHHTDPRAPEGDPGTFYRVACTGHHASAASQFGPDDYVHVETNRALRINATEPIPFIEVAARTVHLETPARRDAADRTRVAVKV